MDGLSGLFRSPEKIVNTNLNTSVVRVIYIITMLQFCCCKNCMCWNLINALETQSSSSMAYYFLGQLLQTSHTTEMLLTHCKKQCWKSSLQNSPLIHIEKAPGGPWLGNSSSTSSKSSSQTLHCNKVVFLKASMEGAS